MIARRLAPLLALLLGLTPAAADQTNGGIPSFAGLYGAITAPAARAALGAITCPGNGTCAPLSLFLPALQAAVSTVPDVGGDLRTAIAVTSPAWLELSGGLIVKGGALETVIKARYGLNDSQVSAIYTAVGASVSSGGQVATFTLPNLTGDCSNGAGTTVVTCSKTGGSPFAPSATIDATNAGNIGSGTLPAARTPTMSPHVASLAALIAVAVPPNGIVVRDGFYAAGDGGAATYQWSAGACSNADNGAQVSAAAGGCWTADFARVQGQFDIRVWGAKVDGSTNDWAAAQGAVAYAQRIGGGTVLIPAGQTLVNNPTGNATCDLCVISGGVKLRGVSRSQSVLRSPSLTHDIISFSDATPLITANAPFDSSGFFFGEVSNMTLLKTGITPTAGAGISAYNVSDLTFSDILIKGTFNGETLSHVGLVHTNHVDVSSIIWDGFFVNGGPAHFFENCSVFGSDVTPNQTGFHIVATGGAHITNSAVGGVLHDLLMDPSAGNDVFDVFTTNNDFDDARDVAVRASGVNGGRVYAWQSSNDRIGFGVAAGLQIVGPNVYNLMFGNLQSIGNRQEAVRIEAASSVSDINFVGGQWIGNDALGGAYPSATIAGGTDITISGVRVGPYRGAALNTPHAIVFESTFTGVAALTGNNLRGSTSTSILNNAAGSASITLTGNLTN